MRPASYADHEHALTGVGMVLKAAQAADLPCPHLPPCLPVDQWDSATLYLSTRKALTAWAEWLDAEVRCDEVIGIGAEYGGRQYEAVGERFELLLRVVWREPRHPSMRGAVPSLHTYVDGAPA